MDQTQITCTDPRMVEQVTGTLDWRPAARYGAVTGAWFGFLVGLLITFLNGGDVVCSMVVGLGSGVAFGAT